MPYPACDERSVRGVITRCAAALGDLAGASYSVRMTTSPRQPTPPDEGAADLDVSEANSDAAGADSTAEVRPESRQARRYREQMAARAARRGPHKQQ